MPDFTSTPGNAGLRALERKVASAHAARINSLAGTGESWGLLAVTDGISVEFEARLSSGSDLQTAYISGRQDGPKAEKVEELKERIREVLTQWQQKQDPGELAQRRRGRWELREERIQSEEEPTLTGPRQAALFFGVTALPPAENAPDAGAAWELARLLRKLEGVRSATPLLAQITPQEGAFSPAALGMAADEGGPPQPERGATWHLEELHIPQAWAAVNRPGELPGHGVTVAVLDTGYTEHHEVRGRLTRNPTGPNGNPGRVRGIDLLDENNRDDPRDPLEGRAPFQFPGHGTSVASVIASPSGAQGNPDRPFAYVEGIAPGAQILPVRMTTNVVLLAPNKLIPAITGAVEAGADVINVSLGLPNYWPALQAAVRFAVDKGVIVIAAAGNYWPAVVYPAALPECVAAAACNWQLRPWRWSGAGLAVDVLAPGVSVQRALSRRRRGEEDYSVATGTGTTFAAACCSGIAALWLHHHGGRAALLEHYRQQEERASGRPERAGRRVSQAFHYLIRQTVRRLPGELPAQTYGEGLVQADALLGAALPSLSELERHARSQHQRLAPLGRRGESSALGSPLYGFSMTGSEFSPDVLRARLDVLLGSDENSVKGSDEGSGGAGFYGAGSVAGLESSLESGLESSLESSLLDEVRFHLVSRPELLPSLRLFLTGGSFEALRQQLLEGDALSRRLRDSLGRLHLASAPLQRRAAPRSQTPSHRPLRVYAFDPGMGMSLRTMAYNDITIDVPWEPLAPGPVGEYLEVVDVDPASRRAYEPVDLTEENHLPSGGVAPTEGSPWFHQQMVYAVAMKTIEHFEKALGRPVFWASAPYRDEHGHWQPEPFVPRLRIFPHALRARNAYYSPEKKALLFGYFRSPGTTERPGPMVFTCLSYDIIAHETTHALLDGMYRRYIDGSNPDVLAFHEAFSDIVALLQHFTHPRVVRAAIEETRGDLELESRLGQLARQFGEATGRRGSLRDAIGEMQGDKWQRRQADATLLDSPGYAQSPHLRGSILVAAVFDAYLRIYNVRARRYIRLATGGSGQLPPGHLQSDLAGALAEEAARTARHVLNICIRALDYLPPVDVTFGDYLRAVITADRELVQDDVLGYRIAFAESFRAWGIHPEGISSVGPEDLRWCANDVATSYLELPVEMRTTLNRLLSDWQNTRNRRDFHLATLRAKEGFHALLADFMRTGEGGSDLHGAMNKAREQLGRAIGIDLDDRFEVHTLRPAYSRGPDGQSTPTVVVTLTQRHRRVVERLEDGGFRTLPDDHLEARSRLDEAEPEDDDPDARFALVRYRTGSTILFNLGDGRVRYVIYQHDSAGRAARIARFHRQRLAVAAEYDPYRLNAAHGEPFAALHLTGHW